MVCANDLRRFIEQLMPGSEVMSLIRGGIKGWPSDHAQNVLSCAFTAPSSSLRAYRPPDQYMMYILNESMRDIEKCGEELTDELAEVLIGEQRGDGAGFVTYDMTDGGESLWPVTCRVQRAHQQVGCRIWESGVFMGELLVGMAQEGSFCGKTIVELGAGIGQSALLLASCKRSPATIIMTDSSEEVLSNLRGNVEIHERNQAAFLHREGLEKENARECELITSHLNWATVTRDECLALGADVVVAADCLYAEDLIPGFVRALKLFLGAPSTKKAPDTLVVCTMRSKDTFAVFTREIESGASFLDYEVVTDWAKSFILKSGPRFMASRSNDIFVIKISVRDDASLQA